MSTFREVHDMYREQMRALAEMLDAVLNEEGKEKTTGFALLIFPFGEDIESRINYVSNARREDMICGLKEFLARLEGRHAEEYGDVSEEIQ